MKTETRLVAGILFLISTSVDGTFYKLFGNNCEGVSTKVLIVHLVIAMLVSLGVAFLLQKWGIKFNSRSEKGEKSK